MSFTNFPQSPGLMNATHAQADRGQVITITYVPNGEKVAFKAFIRSFSDKFSTNYNSEEVYGRMDPVQLYKGTQRSISIAIDIPSESVEEAKSNLKKCSALAQMQYPIYGTSSPDLTSAGSMQAAPFFKIKFGNLIQNARNGGALAGTMSGFTYEPDTEMGFYIENGSQLFPKSVSIQLEFTPQHEHGLGYGPDGNARMSNFPYGSQSATERVDMGTPQDAKTLEKAQLDNKVEDGTANQEQIDAVLEEVGAFTKDFMGNPVKD